MTQSRIHIIPLGGSEPVHHASLKCWCQPLEIDNGTIVIHHAKDGREKWERQNILSEDRAWGLVYEDIEVNGEGHK